MKEPDRWHPADLHSRLLRGQSISPPWTITKDLELSSVEGEVPEGETFEPCRLMPLCCAEFKSLALSTPAACLKLRHLWTTRRTISWGCLQGNAADTSASARRTGRATVKLPTLNKASSTLSAAPPVSPAAPVSTPVSRISRVDPQLWIDPIDSDSASESDDNQEMSFGSGQMSFSSSQARSGRRGSIKGSLAPVPSGRRMSIKMPARRMSIKAHWDEGDTSFDLPEMIDKRQALRADPNVSAVLDRWWVAADVNNSGKVSREEYLHLGIALYHALVGDGDEEAARESAEDDWEQDSQGKEEMDEEHFKTSIFELADLWTDNIEPEEYVRFLDRLLVKMKAAGLGQPRQMAAFGQCGAADPLVRASHLGATGSAADEHAAGTPMRIHLGDMGSVADEHGSGSRLHELLGSSRASSSTQDLPEAPPGTAVSCLIASHEGVGTKTSATPFDAPPAAALSTLSPLSPPPASFLGSPDELVVSPHLSPHQMQIGRRPRRRQRLVARSSCVLSSYSPPGHNSRCSPPSTICPASLQSTPMSIRPLVSINAAKNAKYSTPPPMPPPATAASSSPQLRYHPTSLVASTSLPIIPLRTDIRMAQV